MRKLTKDEFIKRSKEKHGDKYDYSNVNYVNNNTKVCIICPEHGEFWQLPSNHMRGKGCRVCGGSNPLTKEEFISRAIKLYGDLYDYNKVEYVNIDTKVCIIDKEYGEFWQTPYDHLSGKKHLILTSDEFIKRCELKYGDTYDYSKTVFTKLTDKIIVTCKKHGDFTINARAFLYQNKIGCRLCGIDNVTSNRKVKTGEFIRRAKLIYGDKYTYENVSMDCASDYVTINCKKHGYFVQRANHFLCGHACQKCSESTLEKTVRSILEDKNITFTSQYRDSFLGKMSLDFYLDDFNSAIECQGEQHFKPVRFGGISDSECNQNFKKQIKRDLFKRQLCRENGINLYYINYNDDIYRTLDEILKLCRSQYLKK